MTGDVSVIAATEAFVKGQLEHVDGSHDWWHIARVRNLALLLAKEEQLPLDSLLVVELAALLHDVKDWKYSGDEFSNEHAVSEFLSTTELKEDVREKILGVIRCMGFKNELDKGTSFIITPELAVVQDADRLDAIGAVGIARCFTFGGRFDRILYDPEIPPRVNLNKHEYMNGANKTTTLNHFYEKLLKLKDMMKTQAGRKLAEQRHLFMEQYLQQFLDEWECAK